ncbi:MAG: hypothetical protein GTO54_07980 [Nitrososphaeria archaeon]|nr:hypothetical protein [Nitrososphaeria archaeon]
MREFLLESTCKSFIPKRHEESEKVFPERRNEDAFIYIEAEKKMDLEHTRELVFVEAENIMGIIYNSKSGNTRLKWRQVYGELGRLTGEASVNTLVNLFSSGIKIIEPLKAEEVEEEG